LVNDFIGEIKVTVQYIHPKFAVVDVDFAVDDVGRLLAFIVTRPVAVPPRSENTSFTKP
jgi:hypothetical protein